MPQLTPEQKEQEEFEFRYRMEQEQAGQTPQVDVSLNYNPPEEKTLAGFGGNLLTSGAKFAGDIGEAAMAAPGAVYGAMKLATKPQQMLEAVKQIPERVGEVSNQLGSYLSERYGGPQQILDTLYKDPIGFASDLSTVLGGAGLTAKTGKFAKLGTGLSKASAIVDPIAQAGRAVRAPAAAAGRAVGLPEKLYFSALKPSTAGARGVERAETAVAKGLQQELPVTAAGEIGAKAIIKDVQQKVKDAIAAIPQGSEFDPLKAAIAAEAEIKPRYTGPTKAEDVKAIEKASDVLLEGHSTNLSPEETQKFKIAGHQRLREKYGKEAGPGIEMEKAIVKQAKEQLEQWSPGLDALNEHQGDMIVLNRELEKAVARIKKHQMFGIGTPLMAAAGEALGGRIGAWSLAALKIAFDQPAFKSHLAFAINRAQKLKPSTLTKVSTAQRISETQ